MVSLIQKSIPSNSRSDLSHHGGDDGHHHRRQDDRHPRRGRLVCRRSVAAIRVTSVAIVQVGVLVLRHVSSLL